MTAHGPLSTLLRDAQAGKIDRRRFAQRAAALGMAPSVLLFALQQGGIAAAAPAAGSSAGQVPATAGMPTAGTDGQERGAGGELRLLQWQAPTLLGMHTANGGKDNLGATFVSEPLMRYLPDGSLLPNLVTEVPTVNNGMLAADASSVTYTLLDGMTWSDGAPFTARDVAFTWRWITTPENAATTAELYAPIADVTAVDDRTVRIAFAAPQPAWYVPFTGSWWGAVYPEHLLGAGPDAYQAFLQRPIGTGPYVVESFVPGDQVVYAVNDRYREPTKPFFARINLKGGGDAASAARAVLQTGDWDFAWNLQVEPEILAGLAEGGSGQVVVSPGASLEQIYLNFADPSREVGGERSSLQAPHPFLTDPAVRQALTLATDRGTVAERLYNPGETAAANVLVGLPAMASSISSWAFDIDEANRILDEAGWTRDGEVRAKDGVELRITYATTINSVRQKTQAVLQQAFEAIGVATQLKQVDAGVYFDGSPGNDQSYTHFYDDLGMSTAGVDTPYPLKYMQRWYAGPDNQNVAQQGNGWTGQNLQRYVNPDYDRLYEAVLIEPDAQRSAELFVQMNDILVNGFVVIPLVQRAAEVLGVANRLRVENIAAGSFETCYWNVANWTLADGAA